jgi:hypothetical protein
MVEEDETIRCIICGDRHSGRAGDCLVEEPLSPSPQKMKKNLIEGALEKLDAAFRGQGSARASPRRQDLMTHVVDEPPYGDLWCVNVSLRERVIQSVGQTRRITSMIPEIEFAPRRETVKTRHNVLDIWSDHWSAVPRRPSGKARPSSKDGHWRRSQGDFVLSIRLTTVWLPRLRESSASSANG